MEARAAIDRLIRARRTKEPVMDPDFGTTTLHGLLDSMQQGNLRAREELFRRIEDRVRRLCRKMLGEFPSVRAREDTLDVMQNASIRLMRALETLKPASTRDFFGLATEHIRRELLDLTRYYKAGKRPAIQGFPVGDSAAPAFDPSAEADDSSEWQRWCDLHEAAATLPTADREVFGLIFYHGWAQQDVADLLHVSERQVRRLWVRACSKIAESVEGELPAL